MAEFRMPSMKTVACRMPILKMGKCRMPPAYNLPPLAHFNIRTKIKEVPKFKGVRHIFLKMMIQIKCLNDSMNVVEQCNVGIFFSRITYRAIRRFLPVIVFGLTIANSKAMKGRRNVADVTQNDISRPFL